jgi:DNA repair exonuclease SbcCD nuclease subunit
VISKYIKTLPKLKYTLMQNDIMLKNPDPKYPEFKFAVISDLHYYDAKLGTTGTALKKYLDKDRKLLVESADLLSFAIDDIISSGVKNVLIPGDLTKDGELVDPIDVAKALDRLKLNEIQAYVIPGNHDVNNPDSYRYNGDKKEKIPNISAQDFCNYL